MEGEEAYTMIRWSTGSRSSSDQWTEHKSCCSIDEQWRPAVISPPRPIVPLFFSYFAQTSSLLYWISARRRGIWAWMKCSQEIQPQIHAEPLGVKGKHTMLTHKIRPHTILPNYDTAPSATPPSSARRVSLQPMYNQAREYALRYTLRTWQRKTAQGQSIDDNDKDKWQQMFLVRRCFPDLNG